MDILKSIKEKIKQIGGYEDSVRAHINTTRYQSNLLKDTDNWNQICSSLDTIDDTLYSQLEYINAEYPSNYGLKYIFTYGLLQAIFIQQDAMRNLSEAFGVQFKSTERLKEIRLLRNASIGHPTKNTTKKATYFNYISRVSLTKSGFTLMRSFEQGNDEFINIEIYSIINDQLKDIQSSYKHLSEKLVEIDRMHREKYKNNLLINIFNSSMSYTFNKVAEGIHSQDNSNVSFALSMLGSIQQIYEKFEQCLADRNDLNEYIKYDLDEYNHALKKIEEYLSNVQSELTDRDARIYHFYVREQHKHFEKLASEIDDDYNNRA